MKALHQIERKAREALIETLSRVPAVKIDPNRWARRGKGPPSDPGYDLQLLASAAGRDWCVRAEVKRNGHPKQAREAAFWLRRSVENNPMPNVEVYPVFVAPFVSPDAATVCREEGIGHMDLSGNCHLEFGGVYIDIQGRPNQFKSGRILKSLYSPKAERVLRVLLANAIHPWRMQELADEAGVSLGQASNVKKLLLEREWIKVDATGFEVRNPEEILRSWQAERRKDRDRRGGFFALERLERLEERVDEIAKRMGGEAALSGLAGAARLAPMSRYLKSWIYTSDIEAFAAAATLKPVDTGANVELVQPDDEGVYYGSRIRAEARVASPIQVYLDLAKSGGRSEEAAEALLDQVIRRRWDGSRD